MSVLIDLQTTKDVAGAVRQTVECLTGGGLVVFPTETVYGIAALATSDPQSHSCVSPAELKHIMANRSGVVRAGSCTPSSDAPKHAHALTRDPPL